MGDKEQVSVDDVLSECSVLNLRPNDVLVLLCDFTLSSEALERLQVTAEEAFDHENVVVLEDGVKPAVVAKEEADD